MEPTNLPYTPRHSTAGYPDALHLLKTTEAYFDADQLCDKDGKSGKGSHLHRRIVEVLKALEMGNI